MVTDRDIEYIRKRVFFNFLEFGWTIKAVDEGGAVSHAEHTLIHAPKDANVRLQELSDYGIMSIKMAAADLIHGCIPCPYDLDPNHEIGFQVKFTQGGSGLSDKGVTWILKQGTDNNGGTVKTEDNPLIAALDVPLVEKNVGVNALINLITERGIRSSIGLTRTQIEANADLRFSLECDITDTGVTTVGFRGLYMDYVPQMCTGIGNVGRPPLAS